jgi:ABC-type antimicrobial peptide transport system permease subunit
MHPSRPLTSVRTMADYRRDSLARTSFAMVMLSVAATVTLLLGVVGIYGVMAYSVGRRTREVGLRMAMGAEPGAVTGMILRQGLLLTCGGVVVGLGVAYSLTRLMTALLVGVSATDPATYALVSVVLVVVASVAAYVPARRAARVDPAVALRAE